MQEKNKQSMRVRDTYSKKTSYPTYFRTIMLMFCLLLVYLGYINYKLSLRLESIDRRNAQWLKYIENTAQKQMYNVFDNLGNKLSISAQQKMAELLVKVSDDLSKSAKSTIELANSQILKNKIKASEALEIAKKLIKSGNVEKGRIYIINAINHDPSNIRYISELLSLFRNHYKSDYDTIKEIKSIVELSLFQLNPNDVNKAIQYLSELDSAEKNIVESAPESSSKKINWNMEFNKIKNIDLNAISTSPNKLDERYRKLNTILTSINNDEADHPDLTQAVIKEMEKTKKLYQLATIAENVKNYINLLNKEKNYAAQSASARLLAASSSMSLFWEHDLSQIPPKLSNLIQDDFPKKLKKIEEKIKEAKSRFYFEKANKILDDVSNIEMGSYHQKIERSQNAIEKAINLMRKISFKDYQNQIRQKIKIVQDKITSYKRDQYIEYQKWASSVISNVFDNINAETVFDDEDAIRIFNSCYLCNIDLRLCSPEVSQAYNKVFQKITGELPSDKAFRIYKTVMTSQKKRLEDF